MAGRKPNLPRRSSGLRPIHAGKAPVGYGELLEDLKTHIRAAQVKAALSVNRELIALYWHVGRSIVERQRTEGWGKAIVERLANDLQQEFPGIAGFSPRNVWRMRACYLAWTEEVLAQPARESDHEIPPQLVAELDGRNLPQAVAEIPWGHNVWLMEKVKTPAVRLWYARQTVVNGWSRAMLVHWIDSDLHVRQGKAVSNFKSTLPAPQSDLASEVVRDPYTDAREFGTMADRGHRELRDADIAKIAGTHHVWYGDKDAGEYADVPGFCKRATLEDIRKHGHVLTPGRYVDAEPTVNDGEPFDEKMKRLTATLREQQAKAAKLDAAVAANLKEFGYGG